MLRSRVTWNTIVRTVRSKTCPCSVATLLSSYLCTRTLAIGSCKSEKRAVKLHLAVQQQPLIYMDLELFLAMITVDHFPLFAQCRDRARA